MQRQSLGNEIKIPIRTNDLQNNDNAKLYHNNLVQKEFNFEREHNADYMSIDHHQPQNQLQQNINMYDSFDNRQSPKVSIGSEIKNVIDEMTPIHNRYEQVNNEKYQITSSNPIDKSSKNIENKNIPGDYNMPGTIEINEESSNNQHFPKTVSALKQQDIPQLINVINTLIVSILLNIFEQY